MVVSILTAWTTDPLVTTSVWPQCPKYTTMLKFHVSATTILSIDLSQDWTNSSVTIQSTPKIASCWDLCDPTVWYHEQEGILYTGFGGWKSDLALNATVDGGDRSMCTFRPNGAGSGAWEDLDNSAELGNIGEPSQTLNTFSRTPLSLLEDTMSITREASLRQRCSNSIWRSRLSRILALWVTSLMKAP